MTGSQVNFIRRGQLLVPADTTALPAVVDAAPADIATAEPTLGDRFRAVLPDVTGWRQRKTERLATGDTRKVRRAQYRTAEQEGLAEVTNPKVIRAEYANATAAALEKAAADPKAEAYANRRIRKAALFMTGAGITLGVLISSSAAQATIAHFMGWKAGTLAYWAAYGADPALGLVLFATLLVRAVATTRGVRIDEGTRKVFNGIELGLFALVALLNAGPSLGALLTAVGSWSWSGVGKAGMVLVIHTLGPVLVAAGVFGLPYVASVLAAISAATTARQEAPGERQEFAEVDQSQASDTARTQVSEDRGPGPINHRKRLAVADLSDADQEVLTAAMQAIDEGRLDPDPTGTAIYRVVMGSRGDKGRSSRVRPWLAGYRPEIKAVS